MDPSLVQTPALTAWPVVAPEARAPRSLGLDQDEDVPLTPSLQTHICSRASGEVSHFFPAFLLNKTLGQLVFTLCMLKQPKNQQKTR